MKIFKKIAIINIILLIITGWWAVDIDAAYDSNQKKIENSLYSSNYSDYSIYILKTAENRILKWNRADQKRTNLVTFNCPVFSPSVEIIEDKKIALDKQKIFKVYSIYSAIKKYNANKACVCFYQWAVDNKCKMHELLQQSYNIQDYPEHGAIVKSNSENKYYWVNITGIKDDKRLCVAFKNNDPLDSDIFSMLSEDNMWNQLKSSKLNLGKTKLMVLDNFDILNNSWGFLFYDGNSEYYMSPNEYTYYQEIRLSEYIRPDEKNERTILPYKLYNVTDDLIPFLLKEYNLYITLEERAHAAG